MPERATVNQIVQIGTETVEGTPVAALKRLGAFRMLLTPNMEFADPTYGAGAKYPQAAPMIREWTDMSVEEGVLDYNHVNYPLASALTAPVITTPAGATNARQFEYLPATFGGDSPVSYTMQQGDNWIAEQAAGVRFNEFGYTLSRDSAPEMSGAGFGRFYTPSSQLSTNEVQTVTITGSPTGGNFTLTYAGQTTGTIAWNAIASVVQTALEALSNIAVGDVNVTGGPGPATPYLVEFRGLLGHQDVVLMTAAAGGLTPSGGVTITASTPGAAPTDIAIVPVMPGDVSVYIDATAAALGTTKLLRDFEVAVSIGDRYGQVWALDAAQSSYVATVEMRPSGTIDLTVEADATGMALLAIARAGTFQFVRVEAKAPLAQAIDAGNDPSRYRFTHDMAMKITEVGPIEDRDGVMAFTLTGTIMHEAVYGRAHKLQVVTTLLAL